MNKMPKISRQEVALCRVLQHCRYMPKRAKTSCHGNLDLILRDGTSTWRLNVFMKIVEDFPKHYAVLYRDADCSFQYGCFNCSEVVVKHTHGSINQFEIAKTHDRSGLLFEVQTVLDVERWTQALRSKNIPKRLQ